MLKAGERIRKGIAEARLSRAARRPMDLRCMSLWM